MGATATNIALICDGEIIYMRSIPIAGEAYDRAICTYLLRERGVKVSLRTAEAIKITIGSVWSDGSGGEMQVSARREGEVDPLTVTIRGEEMYRALEEPTASILEAICVAISHIPTQYVHEVFAHGIILSGGTAMLDGLDRMISGVTGVKTVKAANPIRAVCRGLDKILTSLGDRSIASVRNLSGLYLSKCRVHGA
jgi:rod shape-determining protein MreB